MTQEELISGCRKGDRGAQRTLYDRYAPRFFGICKRYLQDARDAEDAMLKGFFKVFQNIGQYEDRGNFEAWMRRILVNECLMHIRKHHRFPEQVEIREDDATTDLSADRQLSENELKSIIDALPAGYRTVFCLYVIEGYKHREIAEMLEISINTSKSQLILAKKKLREILKGQQYHEAG